MGMGPLAYTHRLLLPLIQGAGLVPEVLAIGLSTRVGAGGALLSGQGLRPPAGPLAPSSVASGADGGDSPHSLSWSQRWVPPGVVEFSWGCAACPLWVMCPAVWLSVPKPRGPRVP